MLCQLFYCLLIILALIYGGFCIYIYIWNIRPYKPCTSSESLKGKTVIITGSSAGIGKAAAMEFAMRGARLILACRNLKKTQRIAENIIMCSGNKDVHIRLLDTSSLASVRKFAKGILEEEKRLDVLALNAGIAPKAKRATSVDEFELTIATNHFGHFLLANLLSGLLKKSAPSRIVVTSSTAHTFISDLATEDLNMKKVYSPPTAYSITKLCNVYMTRHLAQLLEGKGVTVNCFCPKGVATELIDTTDVFLYKFFKIIIPECLSRTNEQGAQTLIHLAIAKEVENISGEFFTDCKVNRSTALSYDKEKIKRVWDLSESFVDLKPEEKTI